MPLPFASTSRGTHSVHTAFRTLHRRLLRRRLASWDTRLWIALVALCGSVGGFVALQLRLLFDHAVHEGGVVRAYPILAATIVMLLLAVVTLTTEYMRARLAAPPGPEWLALPVPPEAIARHLEREARLPAMWVFVLAAATVFAAAGRFPAGILTAIAVTFAIAWWLAVRAASIVTVRLAARRIPHTSGPAIERVLRAVRTGPSARPLARAVFHRGSGWRALVRLDTHITSRSNVLRARLAVGVGALGVGVLVWSAHGRSALEAQAIAFAAFLVACSQWGAWAALRAAGDPPAALRPLPLSLADRWRARAVLLLAPVLLALLLPVVLAPAASWSARGFFVVAWSVPALTIGIIGLNLGLALPGRPHQAESLFVGWLGASVLASLAIPLLGWGMLAGALVFSLRRLSYAALEEVAECS